MTAAACARFGIRSAKRGKVIAVPKLAYRVYATVTPRLPGEWRGRLGARAMRPKVPYAPPAPAPKIDVVRRGLAVVTGATAGIGAEMARQLSRRGHPVLAVGRRGARLTALVTEAAKSGWATVHPLELDVTAPGAATTIRDRARALTAKHRGEHFTVVQG